MDIRRLFWGFEISAGWPEFPADGRIIGPESRHATMVFLGEVDYDLLGTFLASYVPNINIIPKGHLDRLLLLPNRRKPRVISLGGKIDRPEPCLEEVKRLKDAMGELGLKTEERDWLFHVTVARAPFDRRLWEDWLKGFPGGLKIAFQITGVCLYQSMPGLRYKKLHSFPLIC